MNDMFREFSMFLPDMNFYCVASRFAQMKNKNYFHHAESYS